MFSEIPRFILHILIFALDPQISADLFGADIRPIRNRGLKDGFK